MPTRASSHSPRRPGGRVSLFLVIAASACVLLAAAGCDDNAGERVETVSELASADPRVAVLLPFAADQLLQLGLRPVAVPGLAGEPPAEWRGIPTVAMDHSAGPNLEQLMASAPDVVITSSVYAQFVPAMEQSTAASVVVMDVNSIADVFTHIEQLGRLTGRHDEAQARVAEIEKQIAQSGEAAERVRVLAVFGTPHAFYAFLPSSYLGDLVRHAGGEMITGDLESHGVFRGLAPLSMEAVIDRDPDHLMVVFHGPEESARAMLEQDALWGGLSAVRNGHVTFLTDDLYAMRPGSELPRAINEIRAVIREAKSRLP